MTESEFSIIKIKNPLSEETRKERWHLLLTSAVSITIVKTGLIPTKISALGIEFSQTNQRTLLNILIAITVYFAVAFVIYALSDFWTYRIGTYIDEVRYATELTFELNESIKKQEEKIIQLKSLNQNISEIKNKENEIFDEAKKDFKTQKPYFQDLFDAVEELSKTEGKGEHDEKERKKIADVLNTIKPLIDKSIKKFGNSLHLDTEFDSLNITKKRAIDEYKLDEFKTRRLLGREDFFYIKKVELVVIPRLVFEFVVPLIVGIYTIIILSLGY